MISVLRLAPFRIVFSCGCPLPLSTAVEEAGFDPSTWRLFRHPEYRGPVLDSFIGVTGAYRCQGCGQHLFSPKEIGIARTLFQSGGREALLAWLATKRGPDPLEVVFAWGKNIRRNSWGFDCITAEDHELVKRVEAMSPAERRDFWKKRGVREGVSLIPSGWHPRSPWGALASLLCLPDPSDDDPREDEEEIPY